MTAFLASVTSVEEARIVLECGADIVDLKNPHAGALGALPLDTVRDIVRFVDGRKPVSATIGDLPMQPALLANAISEMSDTGVDIVKIGFFEQPAEAGQYAACLQGMARLARSMQLVAVMFADGTFHPEVQDMADAGFYGVMLDTATKDGRSLREVYTSEQLQDFVRQARQHALLVGLAGALQVQDIYELLRYQPDYLGFRSALCANGMRTMRIAHDQAMHVCRLLHESNNVAECAVA